MAESAQKLILREVAKIKQQNKESYFDEQKGKAANSKELTAEVDNLLDRKLDKSDFREYMYQTINKKEHEMALR